MRVSIQQHSPGRRLVLAGALLSAPFIARAQAGIRVALVIGNSRYRFESSLPNPKRDAADVAARLKAYGVQAELVHDADKAAMQQAIERLGERAKGAQLAAFYYAGHGVSWENGTWLVPVDGDLGSPDNVRNFITFADVRKAIGNAGNRMMVLDNCLNNPAGGWRQRATEDNARGSPGTGYQDGPNTFWLISSVPGRIAPDGPPGQNSPFGAAFLRLFDGASVDLKSLTARMQREVLIATGGRQICAYRNTYREPFVLATANQAHFPPPPNPLAADASRIVEIPNALAFARQNKLPLPPAIVGIRPPAGMPHGGKVGAYSYDSEQSPAILVVFSVEEPKAAEVLMVYRHDGKYFWTWVHGTLANDTLEVEPRHGGGHHVFTWSNASGGNLSIFPPKDVMSTKIVQTRFTRLDG